MSSCVIIQQCEAVGHFWGHCQDQFRRHYVNWPKIAITLKTRGSGAWRVNEGTRMVSSNQRGGRLSSLEVYSQAGADKPFGLPELKTLYSWEELPERQRNKRV
jgi:hypothetical protein